MPRGSIWSVVALGVGVVMLPLILPDSGSGSAGSTIFDLVSAISPTVGLMFSVAAFGLLIAVLGFETGF